MRRRCLYANISGKEQHALLSQPHGKGLMVPLRGDWKSREAVRRQTAFLAFGLSTCSNFADSSSSPRPLRRPLVMWAFSDLNLWIPCTSATATYCWGIFLPKDFVWANLTRAFILTTALVGIIIAYKGSSLVRALVNGTFLESI